MFFGLFAFKKNSNYQQFALVVFLLSPTELASTCQVLHFSFPDNHGFPRAPLPQASCPLFCPTFCVRLSCHSYLYLDHLTLAMFLFSLAIVVHCIINLPAPVFSGPHFLHLIHSDTSGDCQIICWSPDTLFQGLCLETNNLKKMRCVLSGIFPTWNIKVISLRFAASSFFLL